MSFRSSLSYSLMIGGLILATFVVTMYVPYVLAPGEKCAVYNDCAANALATTFFFLWLFPIAVIPLLIGFLFWERPLRRGVGHTAMILSGLLFLVFTGSLGFALFQLFRIPSTVKGWEIGYYALQNILVCLPLILAASFSFLSLRRSQRLMNPLPADHRHPKRRKSERGEE